MWWGITSYNKQPPEPSFKRPAPAMTARMAVCRWQGTMPPSATGTEPALHFSPMMLRLFFLGAAGCLSACTLPDVNLATSEPLKVDIKVDLNVYQHSTPEEAAKADAGAEEVEQTAKRQYNRSAEIQELKNQRYVAETHRGVLLLRQQPAGPYGEYVKKLVVDENTDRIKIMTAEAAKARRELHEVQQERYAANLQNAHPGEWTEVPDPQKPESYKLEQKR